MPRGVVDFEGVVGVSGRRAEVQVLEHAEASLDGLQLAVGGHDAAVEAWSGVSEVLKTSDSAMCLIRAGSSGSPPIRRSGHQLGERLRR